MTAVLVYESGVTYVLKNVYSYDTEINPVTGSISVTINGSEKDYNYSHTFFRQIKKVMFFDNEDDLIYDEKGLCIGYKKINYFNEEKE